MGEQQIVSHGEELREVACGVTKGLPSRSPPIQELEADELGELADGGCCIFFRFGWCRKGCCWGIRRRGGGGYFSVWDCWEGVEEAGLVVVEGHADLVADGGAGAADVVGLPERGDLGDEVAFEGFELRVGDGDAVELFEDVGDAAAFEHDAATGDLGGVRGEDWRDADFLEEIVGFGCGDAGFAEAAEGAAQVAALGRGVLVELGGETAALAVVGLGEVDELEVKTEGSGELVGSGGVVGVTVDSGEGLFERLELAVAVSALESASRRAIAVRRRASTAV